MAGKKNIVILGASGSIGESTLSVIRQHKDRFRVVGLSVNSSIGSLMRYVDEFKPEYVAVRNEAKAKEFKTAAGKKVKVLASLDGVCQLASLKNVDMVLVAIVGTDAILPLLSAIDAKKTVALANKESLVVAGDIVMRRARQNGVLIIPIDSEQSAIFQCLEGYDLGMVEKVYLTASGGPLIDYTAAQLKKVSREKVLAHPRWKMGQKITVDSATLMNKGLEVIEAQKLFNLSLEKIDVLVHRQALIHSLVEFVDGSLMAQMGITDMRLPIQYALTYPERWANRHLALDLFTCPDLSFSKPDNHKFPCLDLAFEAARLGGMAPCALNAANEVAVEAFLSGKITFVNIPKIVEGVLKEGNFSKETSSLEEIFGADRSARLSAAKRVELYQ
ncbi:MAG: 1-deoxy-D-xylulose-5-phosphate reductoisomerase [Candidatus Omnitrophota bacterium]